MAPARVEALRRGLGTAVALAPHQVAVRRELDHLLGGDVQSGLEHRALDEVAAPAVLPLAHREQQGEGGVHAR